MSIEAIRVIENTSSGVAVVGSSHVELVAFFDQLVGSGEVKRIGEGLGVNDDQIRALFIESARLLQLIRPLHVIAKAA
ncbi:hypothetical protein [Limnobacter sp.]|uniref:hypothetical protein n=1 Tax=Limnobacter sp. TaxID=2003368 RepID=UPI00391D2083